MKKKRSNRLSSLNDLFFNHIHLYGKTMDAFFTGASVIAVKYRNEVKSVKAYIRNKFGVLRLKPKKLR
jgi:hypothetical protein